MADVKSLEDGGVDLLAEALAEIERGEYVPPAVVTDPAGEPAEPDPADGAGARYAPYIAILRAEGYVVIPGVFTPEECETRCGEIVRALQAISPALAVDPATKAADPATWRPENLPPGPRSGLLQALVSVLPPVLELRAEPRMCELFREVYSALRGYPMTEFFTSMDGINVRPPIAPFRGAKEKDWPHLDQTSGAPEKCVQGQIVLSTTTAGFRVTPRSHLRHAEILRLCGVDPANNAGNWLQIPPEQRAAVKALVEEIGGAWQREVVAPRGSVILWFSSAVHSAMIQSGPDAGGPGNSYRGWRVVVYVCHRPKGEVKTRKAHAARLRKCLAEGRVTNHWGERMFPKGVTRFAPAWGEPLKARVENPQKVVALFASGTDAAGRVTLREAAAARATAAARYAAALAAIEPLVAE